MHKNNKTLLDENTKRVGVGALITVANVSTSKRQHYFISSGGDIHPSLNAHAKVDIVTVDAPIAKVLMGKMIGDKIFFRHSLVIEFIEWPGIARMVRGHS